MSELDVNRREFIADGGKAALGVALGAAIGSGVQAQPAQVPFDIQAQFAEFMRGISATPSDAGGKVEFIGRDPMLRSHFRIGAAMAIPAMGAGVGAAAIWRERTGESQDLKVDLRESVYNVNPLIGMVLRLGQQAGNIPDSDPLPANFGFLHPTANGLLLQAPVGFGNPLTFVGFETKDNRFFNMTGAYPHLNERALRALKTAPGRENIVRAFKQVNAFELEEELNKIGGVGAVHRTTEEWLAHPEGAVLAKTPLVEIVKIGDSGPVRWQANPKQPLSGLRVLSNTHVIAGTCSARTLAEYGAEVLHLARDQAFEHEAFVIDVNVGMRSTFVDLRNVEQNKRIKALVPQADVFVENFRPGTLDRLGFGAQELARARPGIIYLSVNGYSATGPWSTRGGFDMEGLTVSGFTMSEGGGSRPRFPPTLVMNDYIAGYLGAAGVLAALRRRAKEGGSYHVRISLARAAMWYASLGRFPTTDFDANDPAHRMVDPRLLVRQTPYGEIRRLAPQVQLSRTPGNWRDPLVAVRGGDKAAWQA
jgi:crotonobetainyl-CoA:carnitine CoA-transferase CaiB-like acyl-CoA transferase